MAKEKAQETSEDILKAISEAEVETSPEGEEPEAEELLFKSPEGEPEEPEELEGGEPSGEEPETPESEKVTELGLDPSRFKIVDGKLHAKLIVDGLEEWSPIEKAALEYGQKGRFLEKDRAKDKGEKTEKFNPEEADRLFMAEVKKHGFVGAVGRLYAQIRAQERSQDIEGRKEARRIADSSEWGKEAEYRNYFNTLLDDGISAEDAGLKVSAKYWEDMARTGEERGAKKAEKQQGVKMVKGKDVAPDMRETKTEGSVMQEFAEAYKEKKPTQELLKIMKKAGVQIGQDTI